MEWLWDLIKVGFGAVVGVLGKEFLPQLRDRWRRLPEPIPQSAADILLEYRDQLAKTPLDADRWFKANYKAHWLRKEGQIESISPHGGGDVTLDIGEVACRLPAKEVKFLRIGQNVAVIGRIDYISRPSGGSFMVLDRGRIVKTQVGDEEKLPRQHPMPSSVD